MKYSYLKEIVEAHAKQLKDNAAYSGSHDDGGCENLLKKLDKVKQNLILLMDLRPSEFEQLNDGEVGVPKEFSEVYIALANKFFS